MRCSRLPHGRHLQHPDESPWRMEILRGLLGISTGVSFHPTPPRHRYFPRGVGHSPPYGRAAVIDRRSRAVVESRGAARGHVSCRERRAARTARAATASLVHEGQSPRRVRRVTTGGRSGSGSCGPTRPRPSPTIGDVGHTRAERGEGNRSGRVAEAATCANVGDSHLRFEARTAPRVSFQEFMLLAATRRAGTQSDRRAESLSRLWGQLMRRDI